MMISERSVLIILAAAMIVAVPVAVSEMSDAQIDGVEPISDTTDSNFGKNTEQREMTIILTIVLTAVLIIVLAGMLLLKKKMNGGHL